MATDGATDTRDVLTSAAESFTVNSKSRASSILRYTVHRLSTSDEKYKCAISRFLHIKYGGRAGTTPAGWLAGCACVAGAGGALVPAR
jgi:hypothetical protein